MKVHKSLDNGFNPEERYVMHTCKEKGTALHIMFMSVRVSYRIFIRVCHCFDANL